MENFMNILIICTLVTILILSLLCVKGKVDEQEFFEPEVSSAIVNLGNNETLARAILKYLGNTHTKVQKNKDDTAKVSFYTCVSDTITISNNKDPKELARFVHVAHECIHSIQNKALLFFHFIISNIQILYFLAIFVYFFYTDNQNIKFNLLIIQVFLFFITFFIKIVLESDASYRAISVASSYIESRTERRIALKFENCLKDKLYSLMPKFYFSLFTQGATLLLLAQLGAFFSERMI